MAITVIIEFFLQPDRAADVLEGMKQMLPETRVYEGCRSVDVLRDDADPAHVVLIERWEQKADQQRYMTWRQETGAMDGVVAVSSAPPKVTFFEELPEL